MTQFNVIRRNRRASGSSRNSLLLLHLWIVFYYVNARDSVLGVINRSLQQFSSDHTSDITKMLQDLVSKELLVKEGYGRWASYRLSERLARSGHKEERTPNTTTENSGHKGPTPDTSGEAIPGIGPLDAPKLLKIAAVAREKGRMPPKQTSQIIQRLCESRFLTPRQIGGLLNRSPEGIQRRFLRPLAKQGQLVLQFPDEPNHPSQAYMTKRVEVG